MARRPAVRLYGVWRQEWGYRRLGASVDRRASSPEQDELAEIDRHEHCLDCVFADLSWSPSQVSTRKDRADQIERSIFQRTQPWGAVHHATYSYDANERLGGDYGARGVALSSPRRQRR